MKLHWVRIGWSLFGLMLFAASWRLWWGTADFPPIPLVSLAVPWPPYIDMVVFAIALISTLICLWPATLGNSRQYPQLAAACFAVAMTVSFLTNQHRLQPWAYLLWIFAVVMAACRPPRAMGLLRVTLISVYLHSGLSKLDYTFLHSIGQQFLFTIFAAIPGDPSNWSTEVRLVAASLLPAFELLIGVGLIFGRTRRLAAGLAIAMHLLLFLMLSPLGLNHQPSVLLWNLFFIWQVIALFWISERERTQPERSPASRGELAATLLVGVLVLVPILEPWGWWDHWLAWGLYAPRNSRAALFVAEDELPNLPPSLQRHAEATRFEDPDFGAPFVRLRIDQWALDELRVPVYPRERFQIGVGLFVASHLVQPNSIAATAQSIANRWTGERAQVVLRGQSELEQHARQFRVNPWPRGYNKLGQRVAGSTEQ